MPIVKPVVKPVVKPPVKPVVTARTPSTAPAQTQAPKSGRKAAGDNSERATKSVTTRMQPDHLDMLDSCVASYESDRTEVIKRSIRLLNAALSGHNSVLIITDTAGKAKEINLVIDGVPT